MLVDKLKRLFETDEEIDEFINYYKDDNKILSKIDSSWTTIRTKLKGVSSEITPKFLYKFIDNYFSGISNMYGTRSKSGKLPTVKYQKPTPMEVDDSDKPVPMDWTPTKPVKQRKTKASKGKRGRGKSSGGRGGGRGQKIQQVVNIGGSGDIVKYILPFLQEKNAIKNKEKESKKEVQQPTINITPVIHGSTLPEGLITNTVSPSITPTISPSIAPTIQPSIDVSPSLSSTIDNKPEVFTDIKPAISSTINPQINPSMEVSPNLTSNIDFKPQVQSEIKPIIAPEISPVFNPPKDILSPTHQPASPISSLSSRSPPSMLETPPAVREHKELLRHIEEQQRRHDEAMQQVGFSLQKQQEQLMTLEEENRRRKEKENQQKSTFGFKESTTPKREASPLLSSTPESVSSMSSSDSTVAVQPSEGGGAAIFNFKEKPKRGRKKLTDEEKQQGLNESEFNKKISSAIKTVRDIENKKGKEAVDENQLRDKLIERLGMYQAKDQRSIQASRLGKEMYEQLNPVQQNKKYKVKVKSPETKVKLELVKEEEK